MTFLAPVYLVAGAVAAAMIVALHFLARRSPKPELFPTARFVPDRSANSPSRAPRPTDILLLATRALSLMLAGAALARPDFVPEARGVVRVIAVDRSRAVLSPTEVRASVRALLRERDVIVAFDTTSSVVTSGIGALDSIGAAVTSDRPASLSVALVASLRAAATVRRGADSIELIIVSPLVEEEWDAATSPLRAFWSGRARIVRVAAREGPALSRAIEVRAPENDPIAAAVALLGTEGGDARARVSRYPLSAADSEWVRDGEHVLVSWPRAGMRGGSPVPAPNDSVGAIVAGMDVIAAPLARGPALPEGSVVARFADGTPAAVEQPHGSGCIRVIGADMPGRGDLALRASVGRLLLRLTRPCGLSARLAPLPDSMVAMLRGSGPLRASNLAPLPNQSPGGIAAWLLVAAALLLLAELLVRRVRSSV